MFKSASIFLLRQVLRFGCRIGKHSDGGCHASSQQCEEDKPCTGSLRRIGSDLASSAGLQPRSGTGHPQMSTSCGVMKLPGQYSGISVARAQLLQRVWTPETRAVQFVGKLIASRQLSRRLNAAKLLIIAPMADALTILGSFMGSSKAHSLDTP